MVATFFAFAVGRYLIVFIELIEMKIQNVKNMVVCAWAIMLSSCGVQIQMETLRPAEVDLGRGSALHVVDCEHSRSGMQLVQAFRRRIAQDGFYALRPGGARLELHRVYLQNPPPPPHVYRRERKEKDRNDYRPSPRLNAVVLVMQGGYQIYRRDYTESVWVDHRGRMNLTAACEEFADEIMDDLTPRTVRYCEYVSPDENNPALEQAARACAAGDWGRGKTLADSALKHDPNCAEAYYLLGLIARHERDFSGAERYFRQAYGTSQQGKYADALKDNARIQRNEARAAWQMQ